MVLIFTDNEILNKDLNKNIQNSRVVYYTDYILEEKEANILITTIQPNKYNFKDFMFRIRDKNIRVILLLENEQVSELKDALFLGIYDIIFDTFSIEDIKRKINVPTKFSEISKYIKKYLQKQVIYHTISTATGQILRSFDT